MTSLIIFLLVGLVAGAIADVIFKSKSFGMLGDLVIGVIGSYIGGYLFSFLGLEFGGLIGSVITATVGALVLLFTIKFFENQSA